MVLLFSVIACSYSNGQNKQKFQRKKMLQSLLRKKKANLKVNNLQLNNNLKLRKLRNKKQHKLSTKPMNSIFILIKKFKTSFLLKAQW